MCPVNKLEKTLSNPISCVKGCVCAKSEEVNVGKETEDAALTEISEVFPILPL